MACSGTLLPVEMALTEIPSLNLSSSDAARLRLGQSVLLRGRDAPIHSGPIYAAVARARWLRSAK